MEKPTPPKRSGRYFTAALLLITALIIHSCKKEHALTADAATPDETAVKMREWLNKHKQTLSTVIWALILAF